MECVNEWLQNFILQRYKRARTKQNQKNKNQKQKQQKTKTPKTNKTNVPKTQTPAPQKILFIDSLALAFYNEIKGLSNAYTKQKIKIQKWHGQ
jgi:hypothetical protein